MNMELVLYGTLLLISMLSVRYLFKRRRRKFNTIRLKKLAGTITDDERTWVKKNPLAKFTIPQLISFGWFKVKRYPSKVKARAVNWKKEIERKKKAKERGTKSMHRKRVSIFKEEGPPVKLTNITSELEDPSGISKSKTDKEFWTVDEEDLILDNVPPANC